ncbi:MAG: N-acetylmuramoyl-L-alanine amidase [Vampirovibrionales bacterium]|nr:N-acetylmuramoyl-L-alanine amidase [Vampirovibrionales bacterium]
MGLLLLLSGVPVHAAISTMVESVQMDAQGGLVIRANQSLEAYAPFATLRLLNPTRLVVDLPNAELKAGGIPGVVLSAEQRKKLGVEKIEIKESKGLFYRSVRLTIVAANIEALSRLTVQFAGATARVVSEEPSAVASQSSPVKASKRGPPQVPVKISGKASPSTKDKKEGLSPVPTIPPTPMEPAKPVLSNSVSQAIPQQVGATLITKVGYRQQALWLESAPGSQPLRLSQRFVLKSPSRLVVDFSPATLADKSLQGTTSVSDEPGTSQIRVGQFEDATVRVVIETEHPERFAIEQKGQQARISADTTNPNSQNNTGNTTGIQSIGLDLVQGVTQLRLNTQGPLVHRWVKDGNAVVIQLLNVAAEPGQVSFDAKRFPHVQSMAVRPLVAGQPNSQFVLLLENADAFQIRSDSQNGGKTLLLSLTPNELTQKASPPVRGSGKYRVVVDAGHGGKDGGATRDGVQEKDLNLAIALRLRDALVSRGVDVVTTRSTDEFLTLQRITEISNAQAPDAFVSVHHNSSTNPAINGIETYFYHDRSRPLADAVHASMVNSQERPDRSVRRARFYVINHTPYPAILCEVGYVSNTAERNQLTKTSNQQAAANAIAEGVIKYLNSRK